ncbi:class I SAM-dependent methyltransferase [Streptomyces sp. NPDC001941]|uniref:class I SAM-dependent methyltransferase n=1 Tax=Streptomyces sp. NPDC001941 TaxID=3154659 RepID=UPI003322544B
MTQPHGGPEDERAACGDDVGTEHVEYGVSAEFYDILQAEPDLRLITRSYGDTVAEARKGVLDVGAGSGLVTAMALGRTGAPVHAVEPAAPMRTALMSRLSALGADARSRVTVHACTLPDSGLRDAADVAVCHNVVPTLEDGERRALWRAVRRALVADGLLVLDEPPAALPEGEEVVVLGRVRVGEDEYGRTLTTAPDRGRILTRFDYVVERAGRRVRHHRETFVMRPLPRELLDAELAEAGLHPEPADPATPSVLRFRRVGDQS